MYSVSAKMEQAILNGTKLYAKFGNLEEEILSFELNSISTGSGALELGGAIARTLTLTINESSKSVSMFEEELSLGLEIDGQWERIPLGLFTATSSKNQDGIIAVAAYDRMASTLCRIYNSNLTYPTDMKNVLAEMQTMSGVTINYSSLPNGIMATQIIDHIETDYDDDGNAINKNVYKNPFDGMSYADVLRSIAQLYGKIALVGRTGNVEFLWYENPAGGFILNESRLDIDSLGFDNVLGPDRCYTGLIESDNVAKIDGVTGSNGLNTFNTGSGFNVIYINNQLVTQEIVNDVYSKIKNLSYKPSSIPLLGDPRIDCCDIATVQKIDGTMVQLPVMNHVLTYDGGLMSTVESYGLLSSTETASVLESPASGTLSGSILGLENSLNLASGRIDNLRVEMLKADYIDAEKIVTRALEAKNAKIEDLVVESINGHSIKNSYILAKALSDSALETTLGIKVYYATRDQIATKTPNEGDLWYETVIGAGDDTNILYEYRDGEWKSTPLDYKTLRANSITAQEINVGELAAISADLGDITGGSLNINNKFKVTKDGILTAVDGEFSGEINATSGTFNNLQTDTGYYVHHARGDVSKQGYIKIATFKINGSNMNWALRMLISQRGVNAMAELSIRPSYVNNAYSIGQFYYTGQEIEAYLKQTQGNTTTATYDLYIKKIPTTYEAIDIMDFNIPIMIKNATTWTWKDEQVDTLPSGTVKATAGQIYAGSGIIGNWKLENENLKSKKGGEIWVYDTDGQSNPLVIRNGGLWFLKGNDTTGYDFDAFNTRIYEDSIETGDVTCYGSSGNLTMTYNGLIGYVPSKGEARILDVDTNLASYLRSGSAMYFIAQTKSTYKAEPLVLIREQSGSFRTIFKPESAAMAYLGSSNYRWNTIYADNSNILSDLKVKNIIENFDWKIEEFIDGLKPIAYRKTNSGSGGVRIHMGFGAQDVAKLCNDIDLGDMSLYGATILDDDEEKPYNGEEIDDEKLSWGLNYNEFIAPMVVQMQKMMREIKELKEEIKILKGE